MTIDTLWAPWRLTYIKNIKKEKSCLFCRVARSKEDKKNLIFYRSTHSLAMLNLYPYNNGHAMVTPFKHIKSIELLNEEETLDLIKTLNHTKKLLDRILAPHGYNIGVNVGRIAGAGIEDHLHLHIVPRWSGDTNFMPITGKTKVISQSLSALYAELTKKK